MVVLWTFNFRTCGCVCALSAVTISLILDQRPSHVTWQFHWFWSFVFRLCSLIQILPFYRGSSVFCLYMYGKKQVSFLITNSSAVFANVGCRLFIDCFSFYNLRVFSTSTIGWFANAICRSVVSDYLEWWSWALLCQWFWYALENLRMWVIHVQSTLVLYRFVCLYFHICGFIFSSVCFKSDPFEVVVVLSKSNCSWNSNDFLEQKNVRNQVKIVFTKYKYRGAHRHRAKAFRKWSEMEFLMTRCTVGPCLICSCSN